MNRAVWAVSISMLCAACGGETATSSSASGSAAKSTSAKSSASATKSSTPAPSASAATSAAPEASASSSADANAAGAKLCAEAGGKEKADFFEKCKVKGPAPIEIKLLDTYKNGKDARLCSITNKSDTHWEWGSVAAWYYDASGKLLEVELKGSKYKFYNHNGSDFNLKPKETKEYDCGWSKENEPKGATVEVELVGWGAKEPVENYYSLDFGGKSYDQRPKGGFPK